MPHEIDQSTGSAAVFTAGSPPWHGLGRNIEDAATSDQAIGLAGLDWLVEQWPLQAVNHATSSITTVTSPAKQHVANVRSDTHAVLGVVGKRYRPFQNAEAFSFCDAVVGEGNARYETAGSLRNGRRVWMLLRMPETLQAGPEDELKPYLLVYNTHDGSSCLRALLTTIRVVCQNTLNLAFQPRRGEGLVVRHRGNLQDQVEQARLAVGLARSKLHTFDGEMDAFRSVSMARGRLKRFFDSLLPPASSHAGQREKKNREKATERLLANFENDANTLPGMRGTLWAALNAATQYADHQRRFRGTDRAGRGENRLDSVWFGSSNDFKQSAYQAARDLVGLN